MSMLSELFNKLNVDTPQAAYHSRNVQAFFDRQKQQKQKKRMDELGRKLMAYDDDSAEGLRRFAQENQLSIDELKELVTVIKAFGMYAQSVKPGERMEILKADNKYSLPGGTMIKWSKDGGDFTISTRPDKEGMETNLYSPITKQVSSYPKDEAERLKSRPARKIKQHPTGQRPSMAAGKTAARDPQRSHDLPVRIAGDSGSDRVHGQVQRDQVRKPAAAVRAVVEFLDKLLSLSLGLPLKKKKLPKTGTF